MQNAQTLPDLKRVSCDGSFLYDFVEQFPDSCHVRDIQTEKYLMTNYYLVRNCGFQSIYDFIGFTQHDIWLDEIMQKKRNLNFETVSNHIENVNLDNKIKDQIVSVKRPISTKRFILRKYGTIRFENSIKLGVLNHDHKVIALLSVFLDITDQIPLLKMFKLYQAFYPKKEAIQKFLSHFDIESDFDPLTPPTCAEIQVLIAMRHDDRAKAVAKQLGYSVATVRNHISHLQDKFKGCALHDVLYKLPAVPENKQSAYAYI